MRITAIVPAYNEEGRISSVLASLTACPEVSQVIVVSDGSTDRTYEEAASVPGVKAFRLPTNQGKGAAMAAGAQHTDAEFLLFLDADLSALTPGHVSSLLAPVISGNADMTIGVFKGGRFLTDLAQTLAPQISGQRCISRANFLKVPRVSELRYGVEMAICRYAQAENLRIKTVILAGVTHPMKEEKIGLLRGAISRVRMYREVISGSLVPVIQARRRTLTRLIRRRLGI